MSNDLSINYITNTKNRRKKYLKFLYLIYFNKDDLGMFRNYNSIRIDIIS